MTAQNFFKLTIEKTENYHAITREDNTGEDNTAVAGNQHQPRSSTPSNQSPLKKIACCIAPPLVCFTTFVSLKAKDTSWGDTIMLAMLFSILFGGAVSCLIARNESSTNNGANRPLISSNVR